MTDEMLVMVRTFGCFGKEIHVGIILLYQLGKLSNCVQCDDGDKEKAAVLQKSRWRCTDDRQGLPPITSSLSAEDNLKFENIMTLS